MCFDFFFLLYKNNKISFVGVIDIFCLINVNEILYFIIYYFVIVI